MFIKERENTPATPAANDFNQREFWIDTKVQCIEVRKNSSVMSVRKDSVKL